MFNIFYTLKYFERNKKKQNFKNNARLYLLKNCFLCFFFSYNSKIFVGD